VRVVHSSDEVIAAVQDAVREGRRVVARGGGHCLEGFVDDPDVRVSLMTGVRHDPDMRAFVIDSGTTLGEVYRRLFLDWGVTLPAGESPYLGLGAHVSGGAFGFLCRQHGLAADHLYGLEVVVVEPTAPREAWWRLASRQIPTAISGGHTPAREEAISVS
jgi:FAD/FMN-containing dehydrogenase